LRCATPQIAAKVQRLIPRVITRKGTGAHLRWADWESPGTDVAFTAPDAADDGIDVVQKLAADHVIQKQQNFKLTGNS
jgi:hypothetical protein